MFLDQHIYVLRRLFLLALGLADFWLLEVIWSSAGLSSRFSFVLMNFWILCSFAWYLCDMSWVCVGKIVLKGCVLVVSLFFFSYVLARRYALILWWWWWWPVIYFHTLCLWWWLSKKKKKKHKKRIDEFVIVFWNLNSVLSITEPRWPGHAIILCLFSKSSKASKWHRNRNNEIRITRAPSR